MSRAVRMGGLTGGILGSAALGGARALLSGQRPDPRALLLTPGNARRLTDELARMRGAAMKMGQLLSMETGDILPKELADVLARLRADAHMMPPSQLKRLLEAEYGAGFLKRFAKFDTRPVAAASIGQVHRAVTKDGRTLALKIQYPGVRAAIDADVANLGALLKMSRLLPKDLALAPFLDEARRQLHEEADYTREAEQLRAFAALMAQDDGFAVPEVHADFCTAAILAMDFVESQPIETVENAGQSLRDDVATRLFALLLREIFAFRRVQTDPNFANYRWQPESGRIVLLDFGATREFASDFAQAMQEILRASLAGDRARTMQALRAQGIVPETAPDGQMRVLEQMIAMGQDTLRQPVVDFGDTRFLEAMREAGMQLGMEENFRHIPPWDVLYLQRKLGGLVLLATRLGARVPMRDLASRYGA